jgi:hypothetical protein
MAAVRGEFGEPFRKGTTWLLGSSGVESSLINRAAARLGLLKAERDLSLKGWPWKPDTSSWVEPTAHALVALKKASAKYSNSTLRERVSAGESQILDVRSRDGGWNYGSPAALGVDLPSYPETTALALLGLQGHGDLKSPLDVASRMVRETVSPLARAWLTVVLQLHDVETPALPAASPSPDVTITAIEALAAPKGNHSLLKTGGAA